MRRGDLRKARAWSARKADFVDIVRIAPWAPKIGKLRVLVNIELELRASGCAFARPRCSPELCRSSVHHGAGAHAGIVHAGEVKARMAVGVVILAKNLGSFLGCMPLATHRLGGCS